MSFDDYGNYDALGLAQLVQQGDVAPLELVDAAIERIERHNGVLNAVVYKAYDEARAVAKGAAITRELRWLKPLKRPVSPTLATGTT